MSIIEYIGYFISLVGVIVAFWQAWKYQSLKRIYKTDAFELYVNMAFILGNTQKCINNLQDENTKEALLAVGKAEGLAQGLLQRSIKNIYLTSNYSNKQLEKWIKEGKVGESHRNSFQQYIDIK